MSDDTALLPAGWQERLVVVRNENTRGACGLCLEVHDLLVSKTLAGREKDRAFLLDAARHSMAARETLLDRLSTVVVEPERKEAARRAIERAFE